MTAGTRGPVTAGTSTDEDLWPLVEAGDHAAFAVVFERHVEAVWNHAYRLTGSWTAAEDLAAATLLTLWRRRSHVRLVNGSARPWLFVVAARVNRGDRRQLARFLRAMPRLARAELRHDPTEELVEEAGARARLQRVLAAIRTLPRAEREAVELCALGGMSTAAAAVALGIAETSVRSRLSRARGHLRDLTREDVDG